MKRMKKMFSLLLAVIMVLAMAVPGFADTTGGTGEGDPQPPAATTSKGQENNGSITIDNPQKVGNGYQEYKAYKIFDVTYSGDNYAYSITAGTAWYNVVENYTKKDGAGISLVESTATSSSENEVRKIYNVVTTNEFSAPAFAEALKAELTNNPTGKDGKPLEESGNSVSVSNLPLGYYFVSTGSGALCNLTTTDPTAEIHDKNDHTFTKTDNKTAGNESVKIGDTITYTITGKVPDTTGFKKDGKPYYLYEITDKMSEGLTLDKKDGFAALKITVDGVTLSSDKYELKNLGESVVDGFVLTIDVTKLQGQVGKDIVVTYDAVVNENAIYGVQQNEAVLKFSNDPSTITDTDVVKPAPEKVYNSQIKIYKFEDEEKKADGTYDRSVPLSGAVFVLTNEAGKYYHYVPETTASGDQPAVRATVEWVDSIDEATKKTTSEGGEGKEAKGTATFDGLPKDTYYLYEVKAPEGYNLMKDPLKIIIEDTLDTTKENFVHEADVPNSTGVELPGTGGIGTTIFYAAGIILMAGAVFFVIRRKRA